MSYRYGGCLLVETSVPAIKQPQNLYDIYENLMLCIYSLRLLMMDGKTVRNT